MTCCECNGVVCAYKCPACLAPYCSVKCCKLHKSVCSGSKQKMSGEFKAAVSTEILKVSCQDKEAAVTETASDSTSDRNPISCSNFDRAAPPPLPSTTAATNTTTTSTANSSVTSSQYSDVVILSTEQLDSLRSLPWLTSLLKSKRLQADILAVDQAQDRPQALKKMREARPEFDEFVVKLVQHVGTFP